MARADYDAWKIGRRPLEPSDEPAQEIYKRVLREEVAPALRSVGLRGSSGRFAVPSTIVWSQLAFQKSYWSDHDSVSFTVSVSVIRRDAWASMVARDPWMGKEPSPTTHIGPPAVQSRVGFLRVEGVDHWWELTTGRPVEPTIDEVMRDLFCLALPWLDAQAFALGHP
jgi:Domain of unknown function (DUF4304)